MIITDSLPMEALKPVSPDDLDPQTDKEAIKAYIRSRAEARGVSEKLATYVAEGESRYCQDKLGDMDIYKNGKPVRARGCWQITEYYHQEITDDQAFSLVWSTEWAMERLKNKDSCLKEWTVCRRFYGLIP